MDQQPRRDELESGDTADRTVSRRAFFNRARLGLLAVAGVAVFGIATTSGDAAAQDDEEKEKKKEAPRDKDREAKEKEREAEQKEKKKKKKKKKAKSSGDENKSNTKKKKSKNGDDSNKKKSKKKEQNPYGSSPHAKYIVKGEDRYGCKDFATQADAQAVLRLEPKDPNGLDGNHDGVACDGQDAFMDGVPEGLMQPPFDINRVWR